MYQYEIVSIVMVSTAQTLYVITIVPGSDFVSSQLSNFSREKSFRTRQNQIKSNQINRKRIKI